MAPKKAPGRKAIDQFRQRIEEKLVRVGEERESVHVYRHIVASLADSVSTQHGPCIMRQGKDVVDSLFADLELYLSQLKKDSMKVVDNLVNTVQGRLMGVLERLDALELSMREAETSATQLFELDATKFQAKYPGTSRQLEECLDLSVSVLAECPQTADVDSSQWWQLDASRLKDVLKECTAPQFVVPEAWSELMSTGQDELQSDHEEPSASEQCNGARQVAKEVTSQGSQSKSTRGQRDSRISDRQLREIAFILGSSSSTSTGNGSARSSEGNSTQSKKEPSHLPTNTTHLHTQGQKDGHRYDNQQQTQLEQQTQTRQLPRQQQHEPSRVSNATRPLSTPPPAALQTPNSSVSTATPVTSTNDRRPAQPAAHYHPACLQLRESYRFTGVIIEMINPFDFWVQLAGDQLEGFMNQLREHFDKNSAQVLSRVTPGHLCAAQFSVDNAWYRACVVGLDSENECSILYVDYGNTERVAISSLAVLHDKFHGLPFQSIRCQLSEIMPLRSSHAEWSEEACTRFAEVAASKTLDGCVLDRIDSPIIPTHSVHLEITASGSECSKDISSFLVEQGLALLSPAGEKRLATVISSLSSDPESSSSSVGGARYRAPTMAGERLSTHQESTGSPVAAHRPSAASSSGRQAAARSATRATTAAAGGMASSAADPADGSRLAQPMADAREVTTAAPPALSKGRRKSRSERNGAGSKRTPGDAVMASDTSSHEVFPATAAPTSGISSPRGAPSPDSPSGTASLQKAGAAAANTSASGRRNRTKRGTLESVECDSSASGEQADSEGSASEVSPADKGLKSYRPPRLPVEDGSLKMLMARVVSPSEFYVHVVAKEPVVQLNTVTESLATMSADSDVDAFVPRICEPCCALIAEENTWYRGVCVGIESGGSEADRSAQQVRVHFVDYGEVDTIPVSRVRRLPEELLRIPVLAVRCSLAVLGDDSGDEIGTADGTDQQIWCDEATERLQGYVDNGRILVARLVNPHRDPLSSFQDKSSVSYYYPTCSSRPWLHSIDVDLFDTNNDDFHFNVHLRHDQFELDKLLETEEKPHVDFSSAALADPVVKQALVSWDPMNEDFASMSNSYGVDLSSAGQAVAGYGGKQHRAFCRAFLSGRGCPRGNSCRYSHEKPGLITNDKEYVFCHNYNIDLPRGGQWVPVIVSVIMEADRFWIQLPFGARSVGTEGVQYEEHYDSGMAEDEELGSMAERLHNQYKTTKYSDNLVVRACGELVAAQFPEDGRWYRAKVVEADEDRIAVFFVDYGNAAVVTPRELRSLQQEFTHLPFQAVECFLGNITPLPYTEVKEKDADAHDDSTAASSTGVTRRWHPQARKELQRLTAGKVLVAKVLTRQGNMRLEVDLFVVDGEDYTNIGSELVAAGFAQPVANPRFPEEAKADSLPATLDEPKKAVIVPG